MSANPPVSCEGSGSRVSRQTGAGVMGGGVAAAAGESVDIAGDGAFAALTGAAGWMARPLLLYLGDRPTRDCLREVMLPTHPPSLAGGEATASSYRVDKAWTVGSAAYEGSDANTDWLMIAVTDEDRCWVLYEEGRASVGGGGASP